MRVLRPARRGVRRLWLGTGGFAGRDRPGWHEEVERLVDAVAALPAARTLDVACGTGFLTRHLRGEVTGLDQSAAMVEIAGARLPGARVVRGDAVPLPFADGEFDALFGSARTGSRENSAAARLSVQEPVRG